MSKKMQIGTGSLAEENISYRRLNEKDRDLFINLRMVFLLDRYYINEPEKKNIENNLKTYFDKHINKDDFIGMVCEYNGNIASSAFLIITESPGDPFYMTSKIGNLMNVYTYPEYRKRGLATRLVAEIIKEAKDKGLDFISLNSRKAGNNLFMNMGFKYNNSKSMHLKLKPGEMLTEGTDYIIISKESG